MVNRQIDAAELSRILQVKKTETQKKVDTLLYNIEALESMIQVSEQDGYKDRLTDKENASVMSKIACLENIKFENFITQIFWL